MKNFFDENFWGENFWGDNFLGENFWGKNVVGEFFLGEIFFVNFLEIWSDVTIAGRTTNNEQGKIGLLSQWTMYG